MLQLQVLKSQWHALMAVLLTITIDHPEYDALIEMQVELEFKVFKALGISHDETEQLITFMHS